MPRHSFFWKILSAFLAFSACITVLAGIFLYCEAEHLAAFVVNEQARPAMRALISAHNRHTHGQGIDSDDLARMADAINSEFYIGSDIPAEWRGLSPGLHFLGGQTRFVYIEQENGINYALAGSSRAFRKFMANLAKRSIWICISGAGLAVLAAFFLSGMLSRPLIALARSIGSIDHDSPLPDAILKRKDETGAVAREINRYQEEMREFARREAAFTDDVSHELRSPLMVLSGGLELLQAEQRVSAGQIGRMERALKRMNTAITAMLCLARKAGATPEPLEVCTLVEAIVAHHGDTGHNIYICSTASPLIRTQRDIATVIIGNLIANACMHGEGDVRIIILQDGLQIENKGQLRKGASGERMGLGLSIAARGCAKLGWKLDIEEKNNLVIARLYWTGAPH